MIKITLKNLYYMCFFGQILSLMALATSTHLRWVIFNLLFTIIALISLFVRFVRHQRYQKRRYNEWKKKMKYQN